MPRKKHENRNNNLEGNPQENWQEKEYTLKEQEFIDTLKTNRITRISAVLTVIAIVAGWLFSMFLQNEQIKETRRLEDDRFRSNLILNIAETDDVDKAKEYIALIRLLKLDAGGNKDFNNALAAIDSNLSNSPYFIRMPIKEIWDTSNLAVTHYQNGDTIFQAKTPQDWVRYNNAKIGCWCYPDNNDDLSYYGLLYNYYAVSSKKGLAPSGKHVPSLPELKRLHSVYGYIGKHMKDTMRKEWAISPLGITKGTNEAKFYGRPGGYCISDFSYAGLHRESRWWTTSPKYPYGDSIYYFSLTWDSDRTFWNPALKSCGFFVRCIANKKHEKN